MKRLRETLELALRAQDVLGAEIDESDGPTLQRAERALRLAIEALNQAIQEREQ